MKEIIEGVYGIRTIIDDDGGMPFDREGQHATGREILIERPDGIFTWYIEYEDDVTVDFDVTESKEEYKRRMKEYYNS